MRLLLVFLLAPIALAQGDREGQGLGREGMWPAPTAKDWQKPVLLTFQRSWKDAQAISRITGKPILICINMDGEIASEHYAGIRYRSREIAPLYEPYVCVIASVYRHTPRDHDDEGNRILCPRFGSVTCGEHIAIEPVIFEKFCDGQRVAPRHICVDLSGKETYDVYYKNDTASVFDAIRDQVPKSDRKPTLIRGDRPILERVASRDVRDRTAVEEAYKKGDAAMRKKLLEEALKQKEAEQLDLMRLAVFGLDVDLSRVARKALAAVETPDATNLISEAMRVPMDKGERDALIAALKRLGGSSQIARWMAGVHQGLAETSTTVDLKGWSKKRAGAQYPAARLFGGAGNTSFVEGKAAAAIERPADPTARIELAEATLALAMKAKTAYASNPRMARLAERHLYHDAQQLAREAEGLGAAPWRAQAIVTLAAYYTGDREAAYKHAEAVMKDLPAGDEGWSSMAVVTIFAEGRFQTIKKAVKENKEWPTQYLADLHAAYTVLLRHPLGTDRQVMWHYDLLDWVGARWRAQRVLHQGLERFTDSVVLHKTLRDAVLKYRGPRALENTYTNMLAKSKEPQRLTPFAALASVTAAEQFRKVNALDRALGAYGRAIAHYEAYIKAYPDRREGADHAIAMAEAACARVAYQQGDDAKALEHMLRSFARRPKSAGTRDGAGITPGETAQMLLARLRKDKKEAEAKQLADALAEIDPALLRPDIGLAPDGR